MNNFRFEFQKIIKEREQYHINDSYHIEKSWAKMTDFLSRNIEETIDFLNEADEEEVLWVSEVFEDIAVKVKSEKYINCLEQLVEKYPQANLLDIVQIAKEHYEYAVEQEKPPTTNNQSLKT